jgi:hypothetical protein
MILQAQGSKKLSPYFSPGFSKVTWPTLRLATCGRVWFLMMSFEAGIRPLQNSSLKTRGGAEEKTFEKP